MPIKPRRGNVTWLRVLLLLALIAVVGGVFGLLYFGRAGQAKKKPRADDTIKAEKGTTLIGQDFDYTYTQGNRPVFRIRGDSIRADKENQLFLDKVGVTIYDQEGRPFEVESREAIFKRATNEGELRGDVHLSGPNDLQLRTQALNVVEQGHTLVTERPAEIHYAGRYLAWGKQLTVKQNEQQFIFDGRANVSTLPEVQPSLSLDSTQLIYERQQRQLRAEGSVRLARGADHIEADRLVATLDPDEKSLLFVRALGGVHGEAHAKSSGQGNTLLRFRGDDLAILMEPGGPNGGREPRTVALEGKPAKLDDKAELQMIGGGMTRTLLARRVEGKMAEGKLSTADGFGGVDLRETGPKGAVLRHAAGQRAQAGFGPDGQVSSLSLQENVSYKDPQIEVSGDRGQMNFASGQGDFFGRPVHARSERGELTGPHLTYDRSTGLLHGDNGVQALLNQEQSGALSGSPLAAGEGPVHVDGKEAFLRDKPRSFLFRGDVRAWRGESLLTAAQLRGDQMPAVGGGAGEDRLTASGGVKTLYIPRPETSGASGGTQQKPIEVTSNELVYLSGKGILTYTGDVHAVQEGRTITCQQLEATTGKDKKVETMTCTGQAHLVDPLAGRDLQGDRAVYKVKERVIEMYGSPVHMKDKDGNRLQGKHMTYTMDSGRVEVKGDPTAAPATAPAAAPVAVPKPAAPPPAPPPPPGGRQERARTERNLLEPEGRLEHRPQPAPAGLRAAAGGPA
jgi:lipopolysaccharide transport protein LptA/LPS export ABC transporter protein LptC